ncbi:uncharacterized protein LOC124426547 [Vespa crabro]|uniref:uncharacterized protein LOC124426547 n=1 Tax=Vespa crabro TaxID=7445 RepID=UPI001F008E7F|nr:uncharacterized protein LOC124426547 [Vespa crabro]
MLNHNVRTTIRLVVNTFRIHEGNSNNLIYGKCYKSFKPMILQFLEERLKNNIHSKETLSNTLKNGIDNNVSRTITDDKKYNTSLIDLKKIQKKEMLNALINFMYQQPVYVLLHEINDIDIKFCNLLEVMSYCDIFKLLLFLSKTVSYKIIELNFYIKCIELLREGISNNIFNKDEIMLCLYFFGLRKDKAVKDIQMTWKYVEFEKLSLLEKCIASETLFKCGIKLMQKHIEHVEKLIESEATFLINNLNLLVPLCKVVRHAGATKNFFPSNLNKEIINHNHKYHIISAVHILKLYSHMYLLEPTVLKRLVTDIIDNISSINKTIKDESNFHKKQIYKSKYIDGFLWSICILNYKLTDAQLLEVKNYVNNTQSVIFNEPKELLRILLSLWILGYQAEFMIEECIKRNIFVEAHNNKFWKIRTSLCLLLHTIQTESPNIKLPNDLFTEVYVAMKIQKSLKTICTIVNGLSEQMKLQNIIINSPAKGIYIAGVSFDHSTLGSFHIDVLNDITCLRNSKIPHGLMNLKLRLIKQLGYQSILIDEDDVKDTISTFKYVEKCLVGILCTK